MEYLMTYGWAILIIAVVLAILFSLNVFSGNGSAGTSCIGRPGFSCSAVILTHAGLASFTSARPLAHKYSTPNFSCVSTSNNIAPNLIAYTAETQTGMPIGTNGIGVYPAQSANIPNFGSFSPTGIQLLSWIRSDRQRSLLHNRRHFSAILWMAYGSSGAARPPQWSRSRRSPPSPHPDIPVGVLSLQSGPFPCPPALITGHFPLDSERVRIRHNLSNAFKPFCRIN